MSSSMSETTTQLKSDPPIEEWTRTIIDAIPTVADTFGVSDIQIDEVSPSTTSLPGNYISIYGTSYAFRIGIIGGAEHLSALVKKMIGAEDDEPLSDEDIWDGIGEVGNILVGLLKTAMGSKQLNMSIGLPMMTTGSIVYPVPESSATLQALLDGIPLFVQIGSYPLPAEVKRQRKLEAELKEQETILENTRRMDAIGQLAAGIAHEINTPIQYIGDNCQFLKDAFNDLLSLIDSYKALRDQVSGNEILGPFLSNTAEAESECDLDFLTEEVPRAVIQSLEGVERVSSIVSAMKSFSHPGREMGFADLNSAIQTTVTVCRNEWKYAADVDLKLDESLLQVNCVISEINQVIMNLIINAAHAIQAKNKDSETKGSIFIQTKQVDDWAELTVRDTGIGIPESLNKKIFEPFFTTKEVGKGTGQGLAIAYSIIVKKHKGNLYFTSEEGQGCTFHIQLPINGPS